MKKLIGIAIILSLSLFSCTTNVEKECSRCYGAGKIEAKEDCVSCKGRGIVNCTYTYTSSKTSEYNLFRGDFKYYTYTECDNGIAKRYKVYDEDNDSPDYYFDSSQTCTRCNGSSYHDCYTCNGYGYKKNKKSCSSCGGDGKVWQEVKVWETW